MAIKFCCCSFISLKIADFSLVIAYFGTPRLHQITPFLSKFSQGSMPPDPPSMSRALYCYSLPMILFLDNKLIIMRKLKNADQIYTYLMKLKFNKCIGPNSCITKKILLTLSIKNLV